MPDPENVSTDVKSDDTDNTTKGTDVPAGEKDSGSKFSSIEDALAEINRLTGVVEDIKNSRDEVKGKLRKLEEAANKVDEDKKKEQGKFKELYEAELEKNNSLTQRIRDTAADAALTAKLTEAGAIAVETALPLVDRSKLQFDDDGAIVAESVVDAITEVKEKHKVLFGEKPQIPDTKRPGEGKSSGGYLDELKKLQQNPRATFNDFSALKQKYNIK